jgi:RNA-directed DNA polymerase
MEKYSPFPSGVRNLFKRQGGKCTICGETFTTFDVGEWEMDHVIPRSVGGSGSYSNLQLVHKACHIHKTRMDPKASTTKKQS